jgi:ribose 5-phosphate isomerase B
MTLKTPRTSFLIQAITLCVKNLFKVVPSLSLQLWLAYNHFMKIIFGSDHAGYELKQQLMTYAQQLGHEVDDVGTFSTEPVDYPDFAKKVVLAVLEHPEVMGCLICGTGIGMGIAANRFPGIRAAVVNDSVKAAHLGRAHNNANILCMGGRIIDPELAKQCLAEFINTPFEGGRHIPRLKKIC